MSCSQCGKPQAELVTPLKRCSRCKTACYCSTDCQEAAWPTHKRNCKAPVPASSRAVCRLRFGGPDNPEPDEIYYLRTSRPHLHDISISGPFHDFHSMFPNLTMNMQESSAAMAAFEELTEMGALTNRFYRVVGPLDEDPSQSIEIEMLRVKDAELKACLPRPVWNVTSSTMRVGSNGKINKNRLDAAHVEEMELEGSFWTKKDAYRAAKRALEREVREYEGGKSVVLMGEQGIKGGTLGAQTPIGVVRVPGVGGKLIEKVVVITTYDTGEIVA